MISCSPFSYGADNAADPIPFAGTARQYSEKAIPHDTRITVSSGTDLNFRCPYYATVVKTLDASSSAAAVHPGDSPNISPCRSTA